MLPLDLQALRELVPCALRIAAADPRQVDDAQLHPAERELVPDGDVTRRQQFVAGRVCARAALRQLGGPAGPVLVSPDAGPCWPAGVRGSITHKPALCLAVVGAQPHVAGVGVDLEPARELPAVVWSRVLTDRERARLASGETCHGLAEARLVFSAKESYYKLYRSLGERGPIGFHDVEVEVSGAQVSYRPQDPGRFPPAAGRCVVGRNWLVTVAWS